MNPWLALGWVALAGVLSLVGLLLYMLGFLRGWGAYGVPAATAALIALPLLVAGVRLVLRWRGENREQPGEGSEKAGLGKGLAFSDTDMGESLRRQWIGVLAEAKTVPLFLVLGSSQPDMRALLADALPLSRKVPASGGDSAFLNLYVMDNAAWLVVSPQVLGVTPSSASADASLQGFVSLGALGKDGIGWDILLELLPSFPGPVVGAVLIMLPQNLTREGTVHSEVFGRRLAALRGRLKRRVPLWLVLDRMDQTPGGKGFCHALQPGNSDCFRPAESEGSLRLPGGGEAATANALFTKPFIPQVEAQKPFGVVLESVRSQFQPSSGEAEKPIAASGAYVRSIGDDFDRLVDSLRNVSAQYDSALLRVSPFSGDVLLLRHSLRSYKAAFCSYGDALIRHNGVELLALFLCGGAASDGSGRVFARGLFESFIPECAEKFLRNIPYKKNAKIWAFVANAISLACVGLGLALAVGAWQAHEILTALESGVKMLQPVAQERQGRDIPLPLERLYTITALVAEQEKRRAGPAGLFKAPEKAVRDVQETLSTHFIIPLLPTESTKNQRLALWTESLLDWSRTGVPPLLVQTPRGQTLARVDGSATAKGRQKVSEMLAHWERLLPEDTHIHLRWVQDAYDARVFALWQAAANEVLAAVEYVDSDISAGQPVRGAVPAIPPAVQVRDLISAEPVPFHFLGIASRELAFSRGRPGTPEWVAALHMVHDLRTLSQLGGGRKNRTAQPGNGGVVWWRCCPMRRNCSRRSVLNWRFKAHRHGECMNPACRL